MGPAVLGSLCFLLFKAFRFSGKKLKVESSNHIQPPAAAAEAVGRREESRDCQLDIAKIMARFSAMKISVNIGELKNRLSEYLERVAHGDEIEVCKRNIPIATIAGKAVCQNRSQPGWAKGTLRILQPVEGPAISEDDWNMLREDFDPLK